MGKPAGLNPETFLQGGGVSDGDYTLKTVKTGWFDYGGKAETVPALVVTFHDGTNETEQNYSAGRAEHLAPSDDGKTFVHPGGGDAAIGKNSNAAAFLTSLVKSGFPVALLGSDVSALEGTRVTITNVAQPKRPGIKDEKEGKTISLVTKVLELPKGKAAPKPSAAPKPTGTTTTSGTAGGGETPPQNGSGGDLDEAARSQVLTALATAPNNSMSRLKLGTAVMLACANDSSLKPHLVAVKKLAQDATWLAANAEQGGWLIDGDVVGLAR